ncbi:MAG: hypothetical protein WCJ30_27080 [Deltaproteobacteria bacterium]
MSDPSRWLDPSSGAPSGARELLAQAARAPALTPEAKARMAARLAKAGVAGGAVAAGAWAWKGLFGVGVVGLATVVFVGVTRDRGPAPRAVHAPEVLATPRASTPAAPVIEPSAPVVPVAQAVLAPAPQVAVIPSHVPVTHAVASAHAAPPIDTGATSDDELDLVNRAAVLTVRDPSAALALVQQHVARFPRGEHAEERERVAVRALASAGRVSEARARGEAFLRHYPDSIYATPIRDLIRTLP